MDKSRVESTIFFIEKISFSLKFFSGHFYGQSFIKTVRGPCVAANIKWFTIVIFGPGLVLLAFVYYVCNRLHAWWATPSHRTSDSMTVAT